jgi:hypothetical protein
MELLSNKTKEELIAIKSDYIKKYSGNFDKPIGYKQEIANLTKLINSKR